MKTLTDLTDYNELQPNDTSHAALVHLSTFSSLLIPFGSVLGPLITWSIWKNNSRFVDTHGKQSLNFNISLLIYQIVIAVVSAIFLILPIIAALSDLKADVNPIPVLFSIPGVLLLTGSVAVISLARIVLVIIAGIKAGNGEDYKYPLSIQFFK
jgi:uncharacterized Tic20 family protein